jgi:flagellar hook assembly protein FlgD
MRDGEKPSGVIKDLEWDGKNNRGNGVASGVYYCRFVGTGISGRTYSDAQKVVVLR